MSVIDLHPEELIERAQHGTLTAEERARLDEHLARCVACRFECAVSRDFADESALIDGLSARVADALREAASNDAAVAAPPVRSRMQLPRGTWAAAALLLFVSTGIATAQTGLLETVASYVIPRVAGVLGTRETDRKVARPKRVSSPPRAVAPVAPPVTPTAPAPEVVPSEPAAAPEAEPVSARPVAVRPLRKPAPVRVQRAHRAAPAVVRPVGPTVPGGVAPPYVPPVAPAASAAPPAPAPVVAPAPAPPAPDPRVQAAALFADANGLRHDGRERDAVARYRDLQSRFAGTPEARLSLVVLGRLELDRGEARAALASFDAYVSTGERALREQALAGRALALGKLGHEAAACAAFDELLRSYPRSAYASVAQARCERD